MSGDGKWCEYIDHCAIDNGGCDEAVTCTNMNPGRKCGSCPAGYQGNGIYCKKLSFCDSNNGGCSPLASCDESGGSVTCHCAPGYSGSGVGPEGCKPGETTCDLDKGFKDGCAFTKCKNGPSWTVHGSLYRLFKSWCMCCPKW